MSKVAIVENGAVYDGYDNSTAAEWCSPSFLGCSVCVGASAVKGLVTISVGLKTPFGNVSKSFNFNSNVSYTWQPFGKFKITISITNFTEAGGAFSFDLGLNPCIDIPIVGWKCFMFSHHFDIPVLLAGIHNDIDDSQFSNVLAFHSGNGFEDASGSSLLQGDIYNNYLNSQAGIPTVPIASCFPTRQCIPTITSCVTGIPYICNNALQANQSGNAANIPSLPFCRPTIPANQCGFTATLLPECNSSGMLGANAANFPTVPVNQCVPSVQCIPSLSCIPTVSCTGIPFICNGGAQAAYPTTLLPGCQHVTTLLPGCQSGGVQGTLDANTNAANFPTVPVNQCIPSVQCIPTLSCIPTVSCTGIPFICNGVAQAGYPTTLLPGCQHVTTLLPGCQSGDAQQETSESNANANAKTADFPPTIPGCMPSIPCVTNIPNFCQGGHTTALPQCMPHPPITAVGLFCPPTFIPGCRPIVIEPTNANAAAIPTLPVSTCVNTASCFPTISCLPTVSCTGIPFICS